MKKPLCEYVRKPFVRFFTINGVDYNDEGMDINNLCVPNIGQKAKQSYLNAFHQKILAVRLPGDMVLVLPDPDPDPDYAAG